MPSDPQSKEPEPAPADKSASDTRLTQEQWEWAVKEAARHVRLNREQCPTPEPTTPEEEIQSRLA